MKIEFVWPEYIHYAKRRDIRYFDISLHRHILISPQVIQTMFSFVLFGFGFDIFHNTSYEVKK